MKGGRGRFRGTIEVVVWGTIGLTVSSAVDASAVDAGFTGGDALCTVVVADKAGETGGSGAGEALFEADATGPPAEVMGAIFLGDTVSEPEEKREPAEAREL